jgi:hypothetical protein
MFWSFFDLCIFSKFKNYKLINLCLFQKVSSNIYVYKQKYLFGMKLNMNLLELLWFVKSVAVNLKKVDHKKTFKRLTTKRL